MKISACLITSSAGGYDLIAYGEKKFNKVLRAHRLWENYLDTIGTSEEQVHPTPAHHLKHICDNNTVDYLDEKLVSRQ